MVKQNRYISEVSGREALQPSPLVAMHASELHDQLRDLSIIVEGREIPVLERLKRTPRSGKSVRIKKYGLDLPKRSVYDHIISLPAQAEFFLSICKVDLDHRLLASMLILHDLSEAIHGDAPCFTSKELAAETYLTKEEKELAERRANQLLFDALNSELKDLFLNYMSHHQDRTSPTYKFFHMIDKADPIIAIWRYIFLFRDAIDIDHFLMAMLDFFLYPVTQNSCIDDQSLSIVRHLQDPRQAKSYYLDAEALDETLKAMVEHPNMHFVDACH